MESTKAIAVRRSDGSSALSLVGTERLPDAEFKKLNLWCKQMQASYPSQEIGGTMEGFQFDMERLAVRYGMERMEHVLLEMRIKPGQRFSPS